VYELSPCRFQYKYSDYLFIYIDTQQQLPFSWQDQNNLKQKIVIMFAKFLVKPF